VRKAVANGTPCLSSLTSARGGPGQHRGTRHVSLLYSRTRNGLGKQEVSAHRYSELHIENERVHRALNDPLLIYGAEMSGFRSSEIRRRSRPRTFWTAEVFASAPKASSRISATTFRR
jgi:hypothetical protein